MKKRLLTLMSVFAVSALVAACSGGNTASSEGGSDSQAASSEVQSSEGGEQPQAQTYDLSCGIRSGLSYIRRRNY